MLYLSDSCLALGTSVLCFTFIITSTEGKKRCSHSPAQENVLDRCLGAGRLPHSWAHLLSVYLGWCWEQR